ncbi:MAG: hypothetical protein QY317_16260 [Candidatus Jettenia caeni]|nr:MAG: hypothetical protein QY317_16260 [Candidatus Jettenia caeni]
MYNRQITTIKGLSERRRLPRLGKIRLGIKKKSAKGVEYPAETDYFVCPPEVVKVYGEKPTCLDVLFPVEDTNITLPQAYEMYGSGKGLKCIGDGETALRLDEKSNDMLEVDCPCEMLENGKCKQRVHLRVILPKVNVGGIYQCDSSSYNSIVDLNSSIDYVRALVGRIAFVPLKLKRVATETHHEGKKQIHYTLKLELEADINFINTLRENTSRILVSSQYSLPAPVLENPAVDEGATVVTVDEEPSQESVTVEVEKQNTETKEYISKVIFAKLKKLGITSKVDAEKKLYEYCKIAKYEDLSMKEAEEFFIHLQENESKKVELKKEFDEVF